MTKTEAAPSTSADRREGLHDKAISLLLAAIWLLAALLVWRSDTNIPVSMLLVGTVFFIMLVPAMKELVKVLDKQLRGQSGFSESGDD